MKHEQLYIDKPMMINYTSLKPIVVFEAHPFTPMAFFYVFIFPSVDFLHLLIQLIYSYSTMPKKHLSLAFCFFFGGGGLRSKTWFCEFFVVIEGGV